MCVAVFFLCVYKHCCELAMSHEPWAMAMACSWRISFRFAVMVVNAALLGVCYDMKMEG